MERGWLTRAGQAAMERLDLPGDIPAGVPHMELIGEREFFMCRHRGVLSYSTETVEIGGGSLTVESGALGIPAVVLDGGIELSEGMRLWAGADEASAVETRTYAGERWLHVESPAPPPVPAPARRSRASTVTLA